MPGKSVKDFSVPSTAGPFRLSALRGSIVILYFHPTAQEVLDFVKTL